MRRVIVSFMENLLLSCTATVACGWAMLLCVYEEFGRKCPIEAAGPRPFAFFRA